MAVTIDTSWRYNDIPVIMIDNGRLQVQIMPELGAKIWQITFKPTGRALLWQHPRLKPRRVPFHAVYDDVFFGGWDELFPNDLPEQLAGEQEPDHGEVWTLPWEYRIEKATADEAVLCLWVETAVAAARVEKRITIRSGEDRMHFSHKLTNLGRKPLPFLWKLHAAMQVDAHSRIDLPEAEMYVEDFGPTRLGRTGVTYSWPYADDAEGKRHDMRQALPAEAGVNEFQYATQLKAGWCAVTHPEEGVGFGLVFDREKLPSCWLFATYGGWRELQTVILEPCTGYPVSVQKGVANGTHRTLQPGETLEADVTAVVYQGLRSVTCIEEDGTVHGETKGDLANS